MNYHHAPRKILLTGVQGSGKTTLLLQLLKQWKARWFFAFDPDREIYGKLGWPLATSIQQMGDVLKAQLSSCPPALRSADGRTAARVAFDPLDADSDDGSQEGFETFSKHLRKLTRILPGRKLIVIDEVQDYMLPGRFGLPQSFRSLNDRGRRQEVDMLFTSQSLGDVNHNLRRQLTEIYCFLQTDAVALDWIARAGFNPDDVKALPEKGVYLHWVRATRTITRGGKYEATLDHSRKGNRSAAAAR